MEINIKDDKLVIEVPLKAQRSNPYDPNYHDEMCNIIGVFKDDYKNGIAYRIDMEYKGKDDQWTRNFLNTDLDREDFEDLIRKLKIDAVYYK
mgnify:CR=1 FL=1